LVSSSFISRSLICGCFIGGRLVRGGLFGGSFVFGDLILFGLFSGGGCVSFLFVISGLLLGGFFVGFCLFLCFSLSVCCWLLRRLLSNRLWFIGVGELI
jgi:hypothetical protein